MHVSVEGGLACSRNKALDRINSSDIGDKGCGPTGAIEVGQTGAPAIGIFDHWALRGRLTSFEDKDDVAVGQTTKFKDKRAVFDAELGTKFNGLNFFGGTTRIVGGLRVASWEGDYQRTGAGLAVGTVSSANIDTLAFGPRIGMRSTIPLGSHFMYEGRSGVAALYGRHKGEFNQVGGAVTKSSNSAFVYSIETSSALAYKFNGTEAGPVASVGLFSEYWFNQTNLDDNKHNRHSWGPFARIRMPLQ